MSILIILLMFIVFGFGAFTTSAETVQVAPEPAIVTVQTGPVAPEALTIEGQPATALAVDLTSGEAIYVAAGASLHRATGDGGWQATGTPANAESTIVDSRNPDVLWAGAQEECFRGGGTPVWLLHSTDAGATWTELGPAGFVPLASFDPGGFVIAHDCSGLLVSRDGGATWANLDGLPLGSQVTSFAVESTPDSAAGLRVLVGVTGEGGTTQLYRVDLSDPAMVVEGPLATWWGHAPAAVSHDGAILIGAPQGVLRSIDGGETWTTLRAGLETTTLEQDPIEFFPADLEPGSFGLTGLATPGEEVYVSGVDGVYRLSGDAWEKVADLSAEVTLLAVEPGGGALLAQTSEPAVLRIELAAGA